MSKDIADKIDVKDEEATNEQFAIREFTNLINSLGLDSNTPDYVLGEYLYSCLESFNKAAKERIKDNN